MANYDIRFKWDDYNDDGKADILNRASNDELQKWASDPECKRQVLCLMALKKRRADSAKSSLSDPTLTNAQLAQMLFDPRSDISADARHIATAVESNGRRIVKHLWIIFVALPFVLAVLFVILKNA